MKTCESPDTCLLSSRPWTQQATFLNSVLLPIQVFCAARTNDHPKPHNKVTIKILLGGFQDQSDEFIQTAISLFIQKMDALCQDYGSGMG
jgi:hypothetical protein